MKRLESILCRDVIDTARTRQYQAWLDAGVEKILEDFDVERGLFGTAAVELPDERIDDYVELPLEARRKVTSEAAAEAQRGQGSEPRPM